MKKFDRVLWASDFDNTMADTRGASKNGNYHPQLSARNRKALEYFMENGGHFAVSTGRAASVFAVFEPDIPHNAPCVVTNGAAIYDYQTDTYLYRRFLPPTVKAELPAAIRHFPDVTLEVFFADSRVEAVNKNEFSFHHELMINHPIDVIDSLEQAEGEIAKCLFTGEPSRLDEVEAFLLAQPWAGQYSIAKSSDVLLEITSCEASKGKAVLALADLLHIRREHIYCSGDERNDLSMFAVAAESFAPSNANPDVLSAATHRVGHCGDCSLADVVAYLDRKYEM